MFCSLTCNSQITAKPDKKDTAPSRRVHTPPLCGSPQDMRVFPAVLHTDSVPRSDLYCYPDDHRERQ